MTMAKKSREFWATVILMGLFWLFYYVGRAVVYELQILWYST